MNITISDVFENRVGIIPVVLMDKKSREAIHTQPNDMVIIRHGEKFVIAVVGLVFKGNIGKGMMVCHLVSQSLQVNSGYKVDVVKGASFENCNQRKVMMN